MKYSFFREKIFCSEPMKKRKTISTTAATATSSPTRMVRSFVLAVLTVAMSQLSTPSESRNISSGGLGGSDRAGLQELAQDRMIGVAGLLHRSHPVEHAAIQKRNAVA